MPLIFAIIAPTGTSAQPSDYYRSPLDIPILLSANFAEMRVSRFHTGIDIKTQGVVGHTLRATADGYISRVTVAPNGYGRAIYIIHPNGTMTVYGHMERFTPEVEEYLRAERNHLTRSDVDLFPAASRFPVKKGDAIGLAGTSGRSTGPHLHYEVRKTSNSRALNPLTNGWITVKDNIPPRIVKLYHIDVDTVAGVPIHSRPRPHDVKLNPDGSYSLTSPEPLKASPTSYFVVEATDRKNDVANTFGIYRARLAVDGDEKLLFEKDGILFSDVRYCCASVLYSVQVASRNEVLMLAVKSGNRLPMYKKAVDRGAVTFGKVSDNKTIANSPTSRDAATGAGADTGTGTGTGAYLGVNERVSTSTSASAMHEVEITIEDDALNAVSLVFTVELDPTHTVPEHPVGRIATDRQDFNNTSNGFSVSIPRGALYEPMFYTQNSVEIAVPARSDGVSPLSPIYRTGDGAMPLQRAMRVSIPAPGVPENLRARACIAMVSSAGRLSYAGGKYASGAVSGSSSAFGTFCVVADTVPPRISASFASGDNLSGVNSVTFTASDNFSGVGSSFTGNIDGEWIIFERNVGRRQYTHFFDATKLKPGRTHTIEFRVRDSCGNSTTWKGTFYK